MKCGFKFLNTDLLTLSEIFLIADFASLPHCVTILIFQISDLNKNRENLIFLSRQKNALTSHHSAAPLHNQGPLLQNMRILQRKRMAKLRSEKRNEKKSETQKKERKQSRHLFIKPFFFETTLSDREQCAIFIHAVFLLVPPKKQDFFSRIFFLILFFLSSLSFFLEYLRDEGNISSVMKGLLSIS